MKIAFLLPSLANKGPIIVVKNLIDFLLAKGVYCEVFYFTDKKELVFDCKTTKIKMWNKSKIKNFDIVHSHGIRPDLFCFLNSLNSIKKVSTIHIYIRRDLELNLGYSKLKSWLFSSLWYLFLMRHDLIVSLSKDAQEYYKSRLLNKNITFIYNGLSFFYKKNHQEIPNNDKKIFSNLKENGYEIIGSNAYLTLTKGLNQVIEILPSFKKFAFVIIGDGPEKESLNELAKNLGVSDRCIFLGYKKNADSYLNHYDYYAMMSHAEGFPLALIEAAAHRKASFVSNIPIFRETFSKDDVVFSNLDDKESLSKALLLLQKNRSLYEENIFLKYEQNYTLEHMGEKYLQQYRLILNRNL